MYNEYEIQKTANILSFFTDGEMAHRKNVLLNLIECMAKENVVWALTCSCAFYFRGIIDIYHDYDIIVEKDSIDTFIKVFQELGGTLTFGQRKENEKFFDSAVFCYGELEGIEFDIVSEFTTTTYGLRYTYSLKEEEIEYIKGEIPLTPIESCLTLYGMMIDWQPRRRLKYELAVKFLAETGVRYPNILKDEHLAKFIKTDVAKLLQ